MVPPLLVCVHVTVRYMSAEKLEEFTWNLLHSNFLLIEEKPQSHTSSFLWLFLHTHILYMHVCQLEQIMCELLVGITVCQSTSALHCWLFALGFQRVFGHLLPSFCYSPILPRALKVADLMIITISPRKAARWQQCHFYPSGPLVQMVLVTSPWLFGPPSPLPPTMQHMLPQWHCMLETGRGYSWSLSCWTDLLLCHLVLFLLLICLLLPLVSILF